MAKNIRNTSQIMAWVAFIDSKIILDLFYAKEKKAWKET